MRFHAWTRELRSLNHLGRHGRLFAGERIRIPVVVAAAARAHHHAHPHHATPTKKPKPHRTRTRTVRPWALADVSQAKVRRVVVRAARQHHVDPTWRSPSPGRSPAGSSGGSPRPAPSA